MTSAHRNAAAFNEVWVDTLHAGNFDAVNPVISGVLSAPSIDVTGTTNPFILFNGAGTGAGAIGQVTSFGAFMRNNSVGDLSIRADDTHAVRIGNNQPNSLAALIVYNPVANIVNSVQIQGNITVNAPNVSAVGLDADINLYIQGKGAGVIQTPGPIQLGLGFVGAASANGPSLLQMGTGPWDGASAGHFAGSASGTLVGLNVPSGYAGDILNYQVGGVSEFTVSGIGAVTAAGVVRSFPAGGNIATLIGSASGSDVQIGAGSGSTDNNVNLLLIAKGSGNIKLNNPLQTLAGVESTGAGTALLGANCPASTVAAPYKWIKMFTSDGSTVYLPVWK